MWQNLIKHRFNVIGKENNDDLFSNCIAITIRSLSLVFALCHGNQGCGLQFVINSFMKYLYMP